MELPDGLRQLCGCVDDDGSDSSADACHEAFPESSVSLDELRDMSRIRIDEDQKWAKRWATAEETCAAPSYREDPVMKVLCTCFGYGSSKPQSEMDCRAAFVPDVTSTLSQMRAECLGEIAKLKGTIDQRIRRAAKRRDLKAERGAMKP